MTEAEALDDIRIWLEGATKRPSLAPNITGEWRVPRFVRIEPYVSMLAPRQFMFTVTVGVDYGEDRESLTTSFSAPTIAQAWSAAHDELRSIVG